MTREQVALLLARIAQFDGRPVTDAMIEAWWSLLAPTEVTYESAVAAAEAHYRSEFRRLMPADIVRAADPKAGTAWARRAIES